MDSLCSIIISASVSIIGFFITILSIHLQFKNERQNRAIERKSTLYLECYTEIEKAISNQQLVFDNFYYEEISLFKAEMKLVASSAVLLEYKKYLNFVYNTVAAYNAFIDESDPHSNLKNYETRIDNETGETDDCCCITPTDEENFEYSIDKYKVDHLPKMETIKNHVTDLLNAMRNDLGNKSLPTDLTINP